MKTQAHEHCIVFRIGVPALIVGTVLSTQVVLAQTNPNPGENTPTFTSTSQATRATSGTGSNATGTVGGTAGTGTPGLPNTGAGGSAAQNTTVILGTLAALAAGGYLLARREVW